VASPVFNSSRGEHNAMGDTRDDRAGVAHQAPIRFLLQEGLCKTLGSHFRAQSEVSPCLPMKPDQRGLSLG
jgi:hypothetical protein